MIRLFQIMLVVFSSMTGQVAAQANVKAGEHAEFSRLVIYLPKSQEWTLEQSSNGYTVSVPGWKTGFNTTEVFNLIPRTRITALSSKPSLLEIELTCDCAVTAEPLDNGGVIIDVGAPLQTADVVSIDVPTAIPDLSVPEVSLPDRNLQSDLVSQALKDIETSEEPHPDLAAFRKSLFENLGQSASLSLIELNPGSTNPSLDVSKGKAASKVNAEQFRRFENSGRLRITSAMDAAVADQRLAPETAELPECPLPSSLDIGSWGNDGLFGDQIGPARNEILGEFDEPNIAATRTLARLYLHFGLGAEARVILDQFDFQDTERAALSGIANIVEPTGAASENAFSQFIHCDANIAIWTVLANGSATSVQEEQLKPMIAVFAAWPIHLRYQLGPLFVAALKNGGTPAAAEVVTSIIERPNKDAIPELTLVSARIEDRQGSSTDDLLTIVESADEQAPEALLYYLQRLIDEDQRIDQSMIDLSFAYAKELEDMPLGHALSNIGVRALLKTGQYSEAMLAFRDAAKHGWVRDESLSDDMVADFVNGADFDDVTRLALYLRTDGQLQLLNPDQAESMVRRFVTGGLPEFAETLLQDLADIAPSVELTADVASATNQLERAASLLRGVPNEENKLKRADLMIIDGKSDAVWDELRDDLSPELKDRVAWATARWAAVIPEGAKGEVAALMTRLPEIDLTETPIASAQLLREGSQSSREAVARLLGLDPT